MTYGGEVECWGCDYLDFGECAPPPGFDFVQVSDGEEHVCAVHADGTAECWGDNADGQTNVPAGTYLQITAGSHQSCAVRDDGQVVCWGCAGWSDFDQCDTPAQTDFLQVDGGDFQTCAVRASGDVVCWGCNGTLYGWNVDKGQCDVIPGSYVEVSADRYQTCALTSAGDWTCWGCEPGYDYGQCNAP